MSKKPKDLWKPQQWTEEREQEIRDTLTAARGFLTAVGREGLGRKSILVDIDYDNLFTSVEKLYGLMDLDKLALDNKRRHEKHMKLVNDKKGD